MGERALEERDGRDSLLNEQHLSPRVEHYAAHSDLSEAILGEGGGEVGGQPPREKHVVRLRVVELKLLRNRHPDKGGVGDGHLCVDAAGGGRGGGGGAIGEGRDGEGRSGSV